MGTLRTTNIQHADASAAGMILAADGTVSGLRATQNTQSGTTYSLALSDSGRTVTLSNAAAVTVNLPAQATVAWNVGETLSLLNLGVGTVTITPAADVTINGEPLTLATSKGGSLVRTASNTWTFIPFSAGVEAANFTNTATGTYSGSKFVSFLSSGSLVIDRAGLADILVVGGGGGTPGDGGGGGAGGEVLSTSLFLVPGTYSITVGGGGGTSLFSFNKLSLQAVGGPDGGSSNTANSNMNGRAGGRAAGSGGASPWGGGTAGGGSGTFPGGSGNSDGVSYRVGGGGGGAGSAGGNSSGATAGNGGNGFPSSLTGSEVFYSAGAKGHGSGGSNGIGIANRGSAGQAGIVIIRVEI